ncbi:alanine racemase, partial [Klebsiella pneumoniae]
VDSEVNVRALSAFFADPGQTRDVLIELGVPGGRCGCRSGDDALALAQRVSDLPGLRLRGLELYEGVLLGDDPQPHVEALVLQGAALSCRM